MKYDILIRFFLILGIISLVLIIFSTGVNAEEVEVTASVPCNPYNCTFTVDGNRGGSGEVMGTPFTAYMVIDSPEIVRFETPYSFWFVTDKGVIEAPTDIQALSIYLAI